VDAHGSGGMTPLAIASFWGYADITAELLRHGYAISINSIFNLIPWHMMDEV